MIIKFHLFQPLILACYHLIKTGFIIRKITSYAMALLSDCTVKTSHKKYSYEIFSACSNKKNLLLFKPRFH